MGEVFFWSKNGNSREEGGGLHEIPSVVVFSGTTQSLLLNGQVKLCQGKYVILHTCLADTLEKKIPIWIPDMNQR